MDQKSNKTFFCSCLCHAISCQYEEEDDSLDISFWQLGHYEQKISFFYKLKLVYKFLVCGELFSDMVSLNKNQRNKLLNYLKNLPSDIN